MIDGKRDPLEKPLSVDGRDLQLRKLRGVAVLQAFNDDLSTLRLRIGKSYETRFVGLLIENLRRHSETVSAREVLMRWSSASVRSRGGQTLDLPTSPSYMSASDGLRNELLGAMTGLHRVGNLNAAAAGYKQAALKELRGLVRRLLPSSNEDDNESSSSGVSGNRQLPQQQNASILTGTLRSLEPKAAEELLMRISIGFTEMLRRLTTHVKLLLDIASSITDGSVSLESEPPRVASSSSRVAADQNSIEAIEMYELHEALDQSDILREAVDIAQDNIVKILRARSEQSTRLPHKWFLRYLTLNSQFVHECESILGQSGAALKTVVNGQVKTFIQQYTDAEKQRLAQAMDIDKWEAKDFSENDTDELQRIISGSLKDPVAWLEGLEIWTPRPNHDNDPHLPNEPQISGDGNAKAKKASIDGAQFLLPSCAIMCMNGVSRFLQLILGIPSMASEIGTCLSFYLQLFDSRCGQLVLGAEARHSAGLKNITSKHLALASQALAFLAAIASYAREFVRRYAVSGATDVAVMQLGRVASLCQEHQSRIYNKLVGIMTGSVASHTKALTRADWDNSSDDVRPYMVALVKDTTSLHRILTKILPEATVRMLMARVFASYEDQLGKTFTKCSPRPRKVAKGMQARKPGCKLYSLRANLNAVFYAMSGSLSADSGRSWTTVVLLSNILVQLSSRNELRTMRMRRQRRCLECDNMTRGIKMCEQYSAGFG